MVRGSDWKGGLVTGTCPSPKSDSRLASLIAIAQPNRKTPNINKLGGPLGPPPSFRFSTFFQNWKDFPNLAIFSSDSPYGS